MKPLPPLLSVAEIRARLERVFPQGLPFRNYLTREIAAKTVFVMLYVGAVEGTDRWLRPDQVTRMTDAQANLDGDDNRHEWRANSMQPIRDALKGRWYAANTREPIRDETLREGLVRTGAVREREGLATTSPQPRYALTAEFASLFSDKLEDSELEERITSWQFDNLSSGALSRIALLRKSVVSHDGQVRVTFPNGETRLVEPGPSSKITKAVIEDFALRFLVNPGVLWLSQSGNQVVLRDDDLAQSIGLTIHPDKALPDLILVDLGLAEPLLVFVEIVATSGAVVESRKQALMKIATDAGFPENQVTFLTAYADRSLEAFRRTVSELAWNSYAWFASEPDKILVMRSCHESADIKLSGLIG